MSGGPPYARIRRRETHSPRSVAAIALAIALMLVFAWLAVEIVLGLLGAPPLLVPPRAIATATVEATSLPVPALVAGGIVVALVGIALLALALAPGRRPRHTIASAHALVVVDDEVVASALARSAALTAGVDAGQTRVTVSRRHADVRLTPHSGFPVDSDAVRDALARELDAYGLEPAVRARRVSVTAEGRVGA